MISAPSRPGLRVSIWTPAGPDAPHGGIKALWVLGQMLLERGIEVEMTNGAPSAGLVIVPEVCGPLAGQRVVRWMLFPGASFAGETVRDWEPWMTGSPRLQVPIIDAELFKAKCFQQRSHVAWWVGKGRFDASLLPADETLIEIPRNTPRGRLDVAEVLRGAKYLLNFDPFSAMSMEAALCGTPALCPASRPEHADTWLWTDAGIGWGMDLGRARETLPGVRDHWHDVVLPECNGDVDRFVTEVVGA